MEKIMRCLLALLLLFALSAAAWNQSMLVSAGDAAGQPVQGAELKIAYQKDSNASGSDGMVLGRTGSDGSFAASLSDSVSGAGENRRITITLWTYYWEGQTRSVVAGQPEAGAVGFLVPYALERVYVSVTEPDGKPAAGAAVSIYGTSVEATAGSDGIAELVIPQGLSFSGFARLGGQSRLFTSDEISISGGKKTVAVALPAAQQAPGQPPARPIFRATLAGTAGLPLANQPLTFEEGGQNSSATTGQDGSVSFTMEKAGALKLRVLYHDYGYEFGYQVEADRNETIALRPQIRIDAFSSQKDGNCYNITASVSDPRPSLPIEVSVVGGNGSRNPQQARLDQNGQFASRVCVAENTLVRVRASNKYESVESAPIELKGGAVAPAAPSPPQEKAAPANASAAKNQTVTPAQVPVTGRQESPALLIAALAAAAIIAGAVLLARKQLSMLLRFILEYVRVLYKALEGRRHRGPPPVIPPEQV